MALTDENGSMNTTMLVSPTGANNGFGGLGGDGWWLILLLLCFGGGWGNYGGMGGFGGMYEFPWLLNGQNGINANTNAGFNQAAVTGAISGLQNSVTAGFGDVQLGIAGVNQNICQSSNGIINAVSNGFANAETAANARQIANMQQAFGAQTAVTAGMNDLAMGLQNCCCENRASVADLKYTVATENCADRQAISDGIKDILTATQAQTTAILNQLCADKIEQKNDIISQLRSELLYARGQASQDVQTAAIQAGQRALANEVEQYVAPRPIPSYAVQNPNCCANYYSGCGCGA